MQPSDSVTTIQDLKTIAQTMADERDWGQFHSPKNLSMKTAIEAAELMEKFVWLSTQASFDAIDQNRKEIEDEMADVFTCLINFCNVAKIDMASAFIRKIEEVKRKYPVDKAKGRHDKYDKL